MRRCLFERLICGHACSDCEVGHTADFTTCDHCPVVNAESYQNLWADTASDIWPSRLGLASITQQNDRWSWRHQQLIAITDRDRSAALPSVAQYAWVGHCAGSVTPVWTGCQPPGGGGRSWLRFDHRDEHEWERERGLAISGDQRNALHWPRARCCCSWLATPHLATTPSLR